MKHLTSFPKLGAVVAGIFLSFGDARAQGPDLPEGPGKDIVEQSCATCHGLELITAKRRSPDGWAELLNRMVSSGAQLDDAQLWAGAELSEGYSRYARGACFGQCCRQDGFRSTRHTWQGTCSSQ